MVYRRFYEGRIICQYARFEVPCAGTLHTDACACEIGRTYVGRLKSDHRMIRNYLKGTLGDAINTLMAAAAYNMRHWMNKNALASFVSWLKTVVEGLENMLFENENQYPIQGLRFFSIVNTLFFVYLQNKVH